MHYNWHKFGSVRKAMMERYAFFLLFAAAAFAGYRFWIAYKAKAEAAERAAAAEAAEERERRRRRVERLKEEERIKKAEQRLREHRRRQKLEEEARRQEEEKKRAEERARRKAEIAKIEEEERRYFEEQRRAKEEEIERFIARFIKPLVDEEALKEQSLDDDIALKRRIFTEGTQAYRRHNYYDDFLFQKHVSAFLEPYHIVYRPHLDTPDTFSLFVPMIERFERRLLEYAAVEYFYAKKSGVVRYGNLKGNRELGVDMILTNEEHCSLISCLAKPVGKEKISTQALIDLYEKLEMYQRDFLLQTYPEFEGMEIGFILVVGGKGTEDMEVDAYNFAKEKFERVLTIQGIVTFLDFDKSREEAKEKYLDPVIERESER